MNISVTCAKFEARCRDGVWECEYEPNQFGTAQVRVCSTGARITITVRERN